MKKTLLLVVLCFFVTSCASLTAYHRETYCNYDGAYMAGRNDGKAGEERKVVFSKSCLKKDQQETQLGYNDGYREGVSKFRLTECGFEKGYREGLRDAELDRNMNRDYGQNCGKRVSQALKGYNEGFMEGETLYGSKSYSRNDLGRESAERPIVVQIASPEKRECIERFGEKTCGYNCVESFGNVRCATHPNHNCIAAMGEIKCGKRCKEDFGKIKCAEEF